MTADVRAIEGAIEWANTEWIDGVWHSDARWCIRL